MKLQIGQVYQSVTDYYCDGIWHRPSKGQRYTIIAKGSCPDLWIMSDGSEVYIKSLIESQSICLVDGPGIEFEHAYYSEEHDKIYGSWRMIHRSGSQVRITCIGKSKEQLYFWPDKVYLGEVISFSHHQFLKGQEERIN